MSLLEKIFGTNNPASEEEQESEFSNSHTENATQLMKNLFITSKNGKIFCIVKTKKKSKNNLKTY
jgi:hypothetical protein